MSKATRSMRLVCGLIVASFFLVVAGCGAKEEAAPGGSTPAATVAPTGDKGTPKVSPSPPANLNPGFKDPIGGKSGGG